MVYTHGHVHGCNKLGMDESQHSYKIHRFMNVHKLEFPLRM